VKEQNEEILTKMPKSWLILRNIWMKKEGSSSSAQSGDKLYGSEQ